MDLKVLIGVVAGVIFVLATVPYIASIFRGNTRPNAVSWFGWAFLTAIAAASQIASGASWSVILVLADVLVCTSVFVISLKFGVRRYTALDKICLAGGLAAIVSWIATDEPIVGLLLSFGADVVVSIPTVLKAARDPHSEYGQRYLLVAFAALLSITSTTKYDLPNLLLPVYLVALNGLIGFLALAGQRRVGMPPRSESEER